MIQNTQTGMVFKLKKIFVEQYNIDTYANFIGNKVYILMFDL